MISRIKPGGNDGLHRVLSRYRRSQPGEEPLLGLGATAPGSPAVPLNCSKPGRSNRSQKTRGSG